MSITWDRERVAEVTKFIQGASRHPQFNLVPRHRGIHSSPAQTDLLRHPHKPSGDMTLVIVLHAIRKEMLRHSQDTIQVLRHLERFSLFCWGSGMSAAVGTSRSGSSQARPKEEGPRRPSG